MGMHCPRVAHVNTVHLTLCEFHRHKTQPRRECRTTGAPNPAHGVTLIYFSEFWELEGWIGVPTGRVGPPCRLAGGCHPGLRWWGAERGSPPCVSSRGCQIPFPGLHRQALTTLHGPGPNTVAWGADVATYAFWGTLVVPNGVRKAGAAVAAIRLLAWRKAGSILRGAAGAPAGGTAAASPSPEWPWPCEPRPAASVLQTREPGRVPGASDAGLASTWTGTHENSEAVSGSVPRG